jgi:hypothetical protein
MQSWYRNNGDNNRGRAVTLAVSRWLSTAAARVRSQVRSCAICEGQSGTVAGVIRILRFHLLNIHYHLTSTLYDLHSDSVLT